MVFGSFWMTWVTRKGHEMIDGIEKKYDDSFMIIYMIVLFYDYLCYDYIIIIMIIIIMIMIIIIIIIIIL